MQKIFAKVKSYDNVIKYRLDYWTQSRNSIFRKYVITPDRKKGFTPILVNERYKSYLLHTFTTNL